ncbi:NUP170 [Candida oxycetoniae]|uniref:NUP170 n=1 Tax=Candida oxycetoniae TaxID=497107 RepID=A0AAI9T1X5_9ASCO|nr:NUP170 [Candida oxycetoniae]KAI3407025.2 NUP170 [Candida oxycetoniae]
MVSLIPSFGGGGYANGTDKKYIVPTIKLNDATKGEGDNSPKFHLDAAAAAATATATSQPSPAARGVSATAGNHLSKRFIEPVGLEVKEASYKISIPDFANLSPLQLGSRFISNVHKIDSNIPHDIFQSEMSTKTQSSLDNYYFDYENGLADFSRFEKIQQIDLPDRFFEEYNKTESTTKIGLFKEIERCWIAIDEKLILWNHKIPQSSFNSSTQFLTLDQIKNTILAVKLVKPKEGIFLKEINYLLLIATTTNIKIFLIKYDKTLNSLEIFNPDLSVNAHGLAVNNFITHPKTHDIYFSGERDGVNIWRLDYSNKSSFTKNKCDKICLTKGGITSVIPSKFSGFGFTSGTSSGVESNNLVNVPESIVQFEIDAARDILYALSNKSVIRVYKLSHKQESLTEGSTLTPSQIFKSASTSFVDASNFKVFERFKIIYLNAISPEESSIIQLIAVTSNGSRILLKLGSATSFSSLLTSTLSSALRLNLVNIKFPPTREIPEVNNELDSFTRYRQYISQLIANQQKSQLLKNTKIAKIISPGVFLCVKKTKRSDKLFVATTNFGYLKKNNKLVEDAEFIKYNQSENTPYTYIHDIVQLTPSMNAATTPNGYANIAASQYTKQPLKFAVLTNFGIMVYQFKTSDQILRSLKDEVVENFIEENGYEETCSTLLYLACSYGQGNSNDLFGRKAQVLFSTCGNNARLTGGGQKVSQSMALVSHHQQLQYSYYPTVDQVVFSDRFYGTCLLIARFLRDIWNKKVFSPLSSIKITPYGHIEIASVKDNKVLIKSLNIEKKQIEYFIGTIVVMIDFFVQNGTNIQGLNAPNYSSNPSQFENEVCLRAENIAFTSILKSLNSMKETFSFLMVLIEEIQAKESNLTEILEFLSPTNQANLLMITFKDLLLPSRDVKVLIKSLISSIINKNIAKGGSIDSIVTSLQTRCNSFCSTNDVFIFKAIESLTKATKIGSRDIDLKLRCLKNAVRLFEETYETLTLENIETSVATMVDLEFYSGAIGMLLNIAQKLNNNLRNPNFAINQVVNEDIMKKSQTDIHDKVKKLYNIIFNVLKKIDLKALKISETNNQLLINEFLEIRDSAYDSCFASKNKDFHYYFYDWFIEQGISERLLDVNTPFVLPYLEQKAENNIALSNILWLYHAKRENYFEAAKILYALSISQFGLDLNQRIEYLSRANGFCNCVCPPNSRQKMVQLSSTIQELFEVADIQLTVLDRIKGDSRINANNKKVAIEAIDSKILSISDLFNNYVDPLGYYDLSLLIFKVSDYKNSDDIMKRWTLLVEKVSHESKTSKEPFYVLLNDEFSLFASRLSSNDIVYPIDDLIKLISKALYEAIEENSVTQTPPKGYLVDLFINSGVSYEKLYYNMRSLIEHNIACSVYPEFVEDLKRKEMNYLIKKWYATDKKLRELIPAEQIVNYGDVYSLETDPVKLANYV